MTTLFATKIDDGFIGATFQKPYLGYAAPQDIQVQMQRLNTDNTKSTNYFNELKNKFYGANMIHHAPGERLTNETIWHAAL